jgi:hypothetical protein
MPAVPPVLDQITVEDSDISDLFKYTAKNSAKLIEPEVLAADLILTSRENTVEMPIA